MNQVISKDGHVKVKLTYASSHPHTAAALTLLKLAITGPYAGEVRVVLPVATAYSSLDAYLPALERLKHEHVIPPDSVLLDYAFEEDETPVLAYVVPMFQLAS